MGTRLILIIVFLVLTLATPARADQGQYLASLVAETFSVQRTYNATLEQMAAIRVREIVTNFAHRDPLRELTSKGWSYGEVLAWNRGYADPFAAAVNGWLTSPTHAVILANPGYTHVGCDHYLASDGKHFFVCIVGKPPSSSPPAPAPQPASAPRPIVEVLPDTHMRRP